MAVEKDRVESSGQTLGKFYLDIHIYIYIYI